MLFPMGRKNEWKKCACVAAAILIGAHLVAGGILCSEACRSSCGWQGMVRRAKKNVKGFVRDLI